VGWSDLGWAMENLWAVSMGRQFFCMSTVGPPNKTNVNYILHKDINNESKQNYPNYQMQMMLLKPVLCFIQQELVESQQIQPNGKQLSIVIGDECVGQAWWNYICQYSAGVYLQCSYSTYIYSVHSKCIFPI
jgi:hypothetical protein